MRNILFLVLFSLTCFTYAQEINKIVLDIADNNKLYINDGESTELHYYELVPEKAIKGVIVVLPSGGERTEDTLKSISLHKMAGEHGIITIIPSINWGTNIREVEIRLLDKIFQEVIARHGVSKNNFVLGGLSNGGMIALKYAQRAVKDSKSTFLLPKGVFGLDTPVDQAHLYEYAEREIKRNFSEAGINEAKWMVNNYNKLYGGSPENFSEKYVKASIYSYGEKDGGNAIYLKDMPIRLYTDLDVEWLMNERQRDLYDWNGTDMVSMINQLKVLGNTDANIKISQGKGIRLDGTKHPHSWSILDSDDCLKWIIKLFE